eukprot:UN28074
MSRRKKEAFETYLSTKKEYMTRQVKFRWIASSEIPVLNILKKSNEQ